MEFHFISNTLFELKDAQEAVMVRKPLLNFDATEFHRLHFIMMTLKCVIAGYGTRYIVPRWFTALLPLGYLIFKLLCPTTVKYTLAHLVIHFAIAAPPLFFPQIGQPPFIMNAILWQVSSLNFGLKVFLDIYVIMTVLWYIFQTFGKEEYEKAIALVCYLYCLNYWTDYVIGNDRVRLLHALVTVYLPVIALPTFSPMNKKHRLAFFAIVVLTLLCLSLKLMKVLMVNGKEDNLGNIDNLLAWSKNFHQQYS